MKQEVQFLLNMIKYILNNHPGELPLPKADLKWEYLIHLAKRHSILNLVHYGIGRLPEEAKPSEGICKLAEKAAMHEIVKCYNQIEAVEELLQACEKAGVSVLAVKGSCTKQHYPQPDMRSMGDIDLLYKWEEHDAMHKAVLDLGYEEGGEGRKHDHYFRPPYIGLEMHRELVASDSEYASYYEHIWDRLQTRANCKHIYEMRREDEYIYSLIHLTEHFRHGGIGIRFIMDVFVYNRMKHMDWSYIEVELKKLGLWKFYGNISRLAQVWFGETGEFTEEEQAITDKLAIYIVENGTYGTQKNAAAISVAKGGRIAFLRDTVFPDLKNMQSMFPWLRKWPILLPYSWALRGVRSILFRRENVKAQLSKYKTGDQEFGQELKRFFQKCGL